MKKMTMPLQPPDRRKHAMAASLAVAILMLVGKLTAFTLTGSRAILSDAAESIIHLGATGIAAFSLWFTAQPADTTHPYGHGKFAYFSAGFEGSLMLFAAVWILIISVNSLLHGHALQSVGLGLAIVAFLALVNLVLGLFLIRVGKRHNALVLVANGQHVLADMVTSAGVVVGVALVWVTGLIWLDSLVGILAGLNILYGAFKLLLQFFEGLMEKANPRDTEVLLVCLQKAVNEGLISDFHQLRHRRVNDNVWIEVHLLVPGALSLMQAHTHASAVEDSMRTLFPQDRVFATSHLEPAEHDLHHPDGHEDLPDPLSEDMP